MKFKRNIAMMLAALSIASVFAGCGKKKAEDKKVVKLPAEEQIMVDSYARAPVINDELTYTTYYLHNGKKINILNAFEPFKIQVDCMRIIQVGTSTVADICSAIDRSNEITVATIKEEIRTERQNAIDEEYEAAKAEAESKGKEFKKEKALADISDLKYVNPYSYKVRFGSGNNAKYVDYEGGYLIDPSKNSSIAVILYKYSIPYVQFNFASVKGMFNTKITQESDWVLTSIQAADCSSTINKKTGARPSYVGQDGKTIAKYNILMSGGINFAGEGFTWDGLMTFCNALELGQTSNSSYKRTSDDNYTYYTLTVPTDQFFINGDTVYQPIATLVATFDKHTQNCIDWTLSVSKNSKTYSSKIMFERGETSLVNVKDYTVDTTDYTLLKKTVDSWLKQNELITTDKGYYLVSDTGNVVAKLPNGIMNAYTNVTINNKEYTCLDVIEDYDIKTGIYVDIDKYEKAQTKEDFNQEDYLANNAIYAHVEYLYVNKNGKSWTPICRVNDDYSVTTMNNDTMYYLCSFTYDEEHGIGQTVVVNGDVFEKLPIMYARTYKLPEENQNYLLNNCKNPLEMREYIDNLFKIS